MNNSAATSGSMWLPPMNASCELDFEGGFWMDWE